jgi:hypothetical protein
MTSVKVPQMAATHVGGVPHIPVAAHVGSAPIFVKLALQVYAAVAPYVSELPPLTPPLTVGAPAFATMGGVPQSTGVQVGAALENIPSDWQVAIAIPVRLKPVLHEYVTALPNVADGDETPPFVGAVAPVHVTGTSQFVPIQPATQVPHVYPLLPEGMQPDMLCAHGSGMQPPVTGMHDGAEPLHDPSDWQVRVALPLNAKPASQL